MGGAERVQSYRDLILWQKAVRLAVESHRLAGRLPPTERFELARQIRRSALSVPSNVAEGNGRFSLADYLRYLSIASGSLRELQTQLQIASELAYFDQGDVMPVLALSEDVERLLVALAKALRRRGNRE